MRTRCPGSHAGNFSLIPRFCPYFHQTIKRKNLDLRVIFPGFCSILSIVGRIYVIGRMNMLDILLRREKPADYSETESITREAFWNQYAPGCCEHYLIHIMRGCPAFIPELDVVAVYQGEIIGNVVCLKAVIHGDDGDEYEVLSLGPISVLPEYQGQGVGSKLIAHTRKLAREMGFRAILLCGDPDYYSRQGFDAAEKYGIRTADHMYAAALLVCGLYENALSCVRGQYIEDSIYEIDEAAAAEFDELFPEKEKISGTPSQVKFGKIVAMRRNADVVGKGGQCIFGG